MKTKSVLLFALVFCVLLSFKPSDAQPVENLVVGDMDHSCCKLEWIDPSNEENLETAIYKEDYTKGRGKPGDGDAIDFYYIRIGSKLGFHRMDMPLNWSVEVLANPKNCKIVWASERSQNKSEYLFLPMYRNFMFGKSSFYTSNTWEISRVTYYHLEGKKIYSTEVPKKYFDKPYEEEITNLFVNCGDPVKYFGYRFQGIDYGKALIKGEKVLIEETTKETHGSAENTSILMKEMDYSAELSVIGDRLPFEYNPNGQEDIDWSVKINKNAKLYPIYKGGDFFPALNTAGTIKINRGTAKLEWNITKTLPANSRCKISYLAQKVSLDSSVDLTFRVFAIPGRNPKPNPEYVAGLIKRYGYVVTRASIYFNVITNAYLKVSWSYPLDVEVICEAK